MDKIIYNIASYKRADTLIKTIQSIYNQCDIINVALNDYGEIPVELYDKKINFVFNVLNKLSNADSTIFPFLQNGEIKQSLGIPVLPFNGGSDSNCLGDLAIIFNGK